jgi:hypothetical protein
MSRQTPVWVQKMITDVCSEWDVDEPREFIWRVSKVNVSSSGRCWTFRKRIVITAGRDPKDRRLTVLHELAHHICGEGHAHDVAFWAVAVELYRRYGLIRYAFRREPKSFKTAYAKSRKSMS